MLIEFSDSGSRQFEVVGDKDQLFLLFVVVEGDQPQFFGIVLLLAVAGKAYGLVRDYAFVFRRLLLSGYLVFKVLLGPGDKEHSVQVQGIEPFEIIVTTVNRNDAVR